VTDIPCFSERRTVSTVARGQWSEEQRAKVGGDDWVTVRGITIAVCLHDTALWIVATVAYLGVGLVSEPATAASDSGAGALVTALFLVTAVRCGLAHDHWPTWSGLNLPDA
jgi:hypothetical protein